MPVVIAGVVAEPLERHLHVLVAEGETFLKCLEDVNEFWGERVCV